MTTRDTKISETQSTAGPAGAHRSLPGGRGDAHLLPRAGAPRAALRRAAVLRRAASPVRGAKRVARRIERLRCAGRQHGPDERLRGALDDPTCARRTPPGPRSARCRGHGRSARAAVETIRSANQEVRELAPKLLSELGDFASAVGVQKLDGMSRYLERFELTVQRVEQEMNGLSSGVSDAAPAAQRLADSLEFLNQVMRGLSGEDSGLALSRVTGADAEQRLKTVVQRNQQFGAAVRKAIGVAEPLVQGASRRAYPAGPRGRRSPSKLGEVPPDRSAGDALQAPGSSCCSQPPRSCWRRSPGCFVKSMNARRSTELRVRENERNQEAIMRLLDELSSLADGDLTVQATVTEDITGAIADSINYAIEALRELVTTINDSAIQLDSATKQTAGGGGAHGQGQRRPIAPDRLGDRIDRGNGGLDRGSVGQFGALRRRGPAFGRHRAQGRRRRPAHHRRHERHSRDHPGDQQADQAARRELAGNRQYRRIDQRHRRTDQYPRVERLDPGVDGGRGGARLRRGCGRGAAAGRARGERHEADRGAGAHDSNGHQRGRGIHGTKHDRRRGRCAARRKCRRGARGDRTGVESDREPRAEHFGERAPAGRGLRQHFEEHAGRP